MCGNSRLDSPRPGQDDRQARPAAGWPEPACETEFLMWDEDLEAERRDFAAALRVAGRPRVA